MMGNILTSKDGFQEETLDKVQERYSGFGGNLYQLMEEQIPEIFLKLSFYQQTTYQSEDSYAVYEDRDNPEKSFAIQLDPLCEVIVIWNQNIHTEIGSWSEDPEFESIKFIQEELNFDQSYPR